MDRLGPELHGLRHLAIERADEIPDLFLPNFFFGCEADDPLNAVAFQSDLLPFGARLAALFGSDIGHFDVPDMRDVLPEAWEPVERGLIGTDDFRDFVFGNPVRFYTSVNPRFFEGTRCEEAAAKIVAEGRG